MKCNKCGADLLKSDFCPECKADVSFYKKAARASNTYYNKGLEQALVRDLSGAIESLKMSVMLDKTNVPARNLLGLCYYEKGEVVEGLSCWVVSKGFNSINNPAVEYIDIVQKRKADFDEKCAAARKYNRVLENAANENYDIALIQLKKIVSQCPGFLKAQLLLALFYIEKKAYARAEKCLKAVLKIDAGNTTAKRYMKEINKANDTSELPKAQLPSFLRRNEQKEEETERSPLSGNDVIIPKTGYNRQNSLAFSLLNILIGIGIGAALIFLVVVPAKGRVSAREYNSSVEQYSNDLSDANEKINEVNKQLDEVKAEKDKLQSELDAKGNLYYQQMVKAADLYMSDEDKDCAKTLAGLDTDKLPEDAENLYNILKSRTFSSSAESIYNDAQELYSAGRFEDAASEFELAYTCYDGNEDAAFYAARAYERADNTEQALRWYHTVADEYSDGEYSDSALKYISENES